MPKASVFGSFQIETSVFCNGNIPQSTEINANTGEYAPRTSDEGKTILRVILGIISLGGVVMLTIIRKRGIYGN